MAAFRIEADQQEPANAKLPQTAKRDRWTGFIALLGGSLMPIGSGLPIMIQHEHTNC
jgi:hypothetical protein